MVAVRFGLVCVVLKLAGRGDQNTSYRFNLRMHLTTTRFYFSCFSNSLSEL
jgi:hypothetical protein